MPTTSPLPANTTFILARTAIGTQNTLDQIIIQKHHMTQSTEIVIAIYQDTPADTAKFVNGITPPNNGLILMDIRNHYELKIKMLTKN